MDVMLQRHCAKYIYVVPEGLRELMSDISREVLRSQPEQIYNFIADYLDALMITRENARVAARLVESITQIGVTIADLLVRTGMTREEADRVATIIQVTFRKYLAEKAALRRQQQQEPSEAVEEANIITQIIDESGITPEQAEQAAIIIQNAYRHFKQRQARETDLLKGMVDWRVAARSTMRLYRKTGVTYEEANRAATLIKAAYKGYYTRRIMKRLLEESERVSEETKSIEGEDYTQYTSYWERFGHETDTDFYKDLEEAEKLHLEPMKGEGDSQMIALSIVDSLLKHVVPSSSTSVQSFTTSTAETPGPLPSEVEDAPVEGEPLPPAEGEHPAEGAETAGAPTDAPPAEPTAEPAQAPPAPEQTAEAPPTEGAVAETTEVATEVIKPPDSEPLTDTTGAETDTTTEYADTTASDIPATTTETEDTTE